MAAAAATGAVRPGRPGAWVTRRPRFLAASGGRGQVQEKGVRPDPGQLIPVQHRGGDGVDDEGEGPQLAAQMGQGHGLAAVGRRPGQLVIPPGGHGDPGPQGGHPVGGELPHPAEAKDEHRGALEGGRQLL